MPWKCCVSKCSSNYDTQNESIKVFKLPKDTAEREKWIAAIPLFHESNSTLDNYRVCRKHWPENIVMVKQSGRGSRPVVPPSVFESVPLTLYTPRPGERPPKQEFRGETIWHQKDVFTNFSNFSPQKELFKMCKAKTIVEKKTTEQLKFIFMNDEATEVDVIVYVTVSPTVLCSPVTFSGYKQGVKVDVPKGHLNPNSGFNRYSQFFAALNYVLQYKVPASVILLKAAEEVNKVAVEFEHEKRRKVEFVEQQLELLSKSKPTYEMKDICFAVEHFPITNYNQLRNVVAMPHGRKIREMISSIDCSNTLKDVFSKTS